MNKDEFIKICQLCGYASKKNAIRYAKEKQSEEFTQQDIIKVHRLNEKKLDISKPIQFSCKSNGEQLINDLNKNPKPWNHKFDASRGLKK
jgi:hypothetical protein